MTSPRRLTAATAGLTLTVGLLAATSPPATATVPWQVLPTGTTEPITAADYRGSRIAFATANGKIFMGTDTGGFAAALDVPGTTFVDLALNPAGDRGVALAENRIWTYDGVGWSEADLSGVTYDLNSPQNTYPNGFCPGTPAAAGTYPAADLHPLVDLVDVEWRDGSTAFVAAYNAESMLLGTTDGGATWSEYGRDSAGNCLLKDEGTEREPALEVTPGVLWYLHRGDIFKSVDGFATVAKVDGVSNKDGLAVDPSNMLRQLAWSGQPHYTAGSITTTGDFDDRDWLDTTSAGAHDDSLEIRDVVADAGIFYVVGTGGMAERVRAHDDIEHITIPGHGATEWRDVALNGAGRLMVAGGGGVVAVSTDPTAPTTTPKATLAPTNKPPVSSTPTVQGRFVVVKVRGRIGRPAGVTRAEACKGLVKVTFKTPKTKKVRAKVVKRTKIKVNRKCVYVKKVRIKRAKLGNSRRLRMIVRFTGNDAMGPSKAAYAIRIKR